MNALLEQALEQLKVKCVDIDYITTPQQERDKIAKAISACDVVRSQLKAM